jgi:hypothetical protein
MKPKRIILIRHGESEGNINKDTWHEHPPFFNVMVSFQRGRF